VDDSSNFGGSFNHNWFLGSPSSPGLHPSHPAWNSTHQFAS
jgi:hypothetical protein